MVGMSNLRQEMRDLSAANVGKPIVSVPRWLGDIDTSLRLHSQFLLAGNTRDKYLLRIGEEPVFLPTMEALWRVLRRRGVSALLIFDNVAGIRLHHECPALSAELSERLGIAREARKLTADELIALLETFSAVHEQSLALVVDYASQFLDGLGENRHALEDFFVSIDKISRATQQQAAARGPNMLPWNPIFWIVNQPGDMPDWFVVNNAAVRSITIQLPDQEERFLFAKSLASGGTVVASGGTPPDQKTIEQFALQTEGLTLMAMRQVATLAETQRGTFHSMTDAIRAYHVGTPRNPWKSALMRARISDGEAILKNRVKGQDSAVRKTLDILVRSLMGLSGSQSSSRHTRPRGVLFFAGPTGVGKTELAKAVTELLFGDETAYCRFDMSEFFAESSEARLIGAPPGAVGHEAGGELVNAVRARPFSVFLFDEIEKAHPRVLDTFLQIIDEGRLTDSRGETAYFSESLLIFTSNVGIFGSERENNMGLKVLPSDSHEALESKIVNGIREHFRYKLQRPELMNRLGQNIVVFDFINVKSAGAIFDAIVGRVLNAARAEHGIEISLTDQARTELRDLCTYDLFEGGRGIANRVEVNFVNPLARLLFAHDRKRPIVIRSLDHTDNDVTLIAD